MAKSCAIASQEFFLPVFLSSSFSFMIKVSNNDSFQYTSLNSCLLSTAANPCASLGLIFPDDDIALKLINFHVLPALQFGGSFNISSPSPAAAAAVIEKPMKQNGSSCVYVCACAIIQARRAAKSKQGISSLLTRSVQLGSFSF